MKAWSITESLLILLVTAALIICTLLCLQACSRRNAQLAPVVSTIMGPPASVAAADESVESLKAQLAAAEARHKEVTKHASESYKRGILRVLDAFAIGGLAVCTLGAVFVPGMRSTLALGAITCAVLLSLSALLDALVPYLPYLGVAAFVGGAMVVLRRNGKLHDLATAFHEVTKHPAIHAIDFANLSQQTRATIASLALKAKP